MILAFYSEGSGTGKDSAATFAAAHLTRRGLTVERDAFAWDGKVVCADALGIEGTRLEKVAMIDRIKLNGLVEWEHGHGGGGEGQGHVNGREFIIGLLGSPGKGNGVRGLVEDFWTRQVIRRSERNVGVDGWTVISDMRFVEEAEAVQQASGKVVEVVRDKGSLGKFNEQRLPLELVDHTIYNVGTLDDLRYAVEAYVDGLLFTST